MQPRVFNTFLTLTLTPASRLINIEEATDQWKIIIQIAKGKLYRILRGTYKTASPWPLSFLCYQIYIFQRFLRRSTGWSATYLTTRTVEEGNTRQAVSRRKEEERGRGGRQSKMENKELGILYRKPLRRITNKEDQGEVLRKSTMRSCTRKAGSKGRQRSWTRVRPCGWTWCKGWRCILVYVSRIKFVFSNISFIFKSSLDSYQS